MPIEKNKKNAVIFWILTVLCMGVIFFLSSRTADESASESSRILEFLISVFGEGFFTDFIVRKAAHCLEFAGLCFLFNFSFYFSFEEPKRILSVVLTSLYAVTDEVHQIFVEGRSCEVRDWAIDTAGAFLGLLAFIMIMLVFKKILTAKSDSYNIGEID
ncbi:MAG: VanZ family protein [Eubacterium sp.]|nr:VanZ family protein [Eubacterium sp.]